MKTICVFALVCALGVYAADPVITEFVAANMTGVTDSDGDASDWIEIYNPGASSVSLKDWYLTDDPAVLDKWSFPTMTLSGGSYRLVFASGKNRRDPAAELHTNFRLNGDGEYLALVRPDGSAVAQEFAPAFPPQKTDFSYGIGRRVTITPIVSAHAPVRVLLPDDDSLGTAWTGGNEPFNDAAWTHGNGGVGYVTMVPGFLVRNCLASTGVCTLAAAEQVVSTPSLQARVTVVNSAVIDFAGNGACCHYARDMLFPGAAAGADENNFAVLATGIVTIPEAGPWTFGVQSDDGFVLDLTNGEKSFRISYPDPRGPADTLGVFDVTTPGEYSLRLLMYECGGGAMVELFAAQGSFGAWTADAFRLVGDVEGGGLAVESEIAEAGTPGGFHDLIGTDLLGAMYGAATSAFVRVPFTVADPAAYTTLFLRMRYDDGFVAYMNGVEVARRNAPATLTNSAHSLASRPGTSALVIDSINISSYLSLLVPGENVLAFHGLSYAPTSSDFLLSAELAEIVVEEDMAGFFSPPTPGAANNTIFDDFVRDTHFSAHRGFLSAPIDLEITTDTPGAEIRYTLDGTRPTATEGLVYMAPLRIDRTTCVRAAAFKAGLIPTNVDTQTYIFLDDVVRQDYQAALDAGFPDMWGGIAPDYGMDSRVIGQTGPDSFNGKYAATIKDDLRTLPTMSIVLPLDDLFGTNGIYTNSVQRGLGYERAASVELIHPDGTIGFQEDCGLRMQGGYFRSHDATLKHSFRLLFKGIYGATKLRYPLFGPGAPDRFDQITLRAGANDSYSWVGPWGRTLYTRDSFMRRTGLDMGRVESHETFVHLYINGFYWGMYNPVEHLDSSFSATYFGGDKENWDIIKQGGWATSGTADAWNLMLTTCTQGLSGNTAYYRLQGLFTDGTPNPAVPNLLDVQNFIDYMIINLYGGNTDWPHNNWRTARDRDHGAGFKFYLWDTEFALGLGSDLNTNLVGANNGVAAPWPALKANADFRMLLADRLQKHFFNGGVLAVDSSRPAWDPSHPERNRPAARFKEVCDAVQSAMVAESARWGDMHRTGPLTRDEHWAPERDNLLRNYFPQRSGVVLQQFRSAGLFPNVTAPVFSRFGGSIEPGFVLKMTEGDGAIYYTLDGTDPRLPGGGLAPNAILYVEGLPVPIINASAPCRVLVPVNGTLALTWAGADFDDSAWRQGTMGVGYETAWGYESDINTSVLDEMYGKAGGVYMRTPFQIEDAASVTALKLNVRYDDGFVAYINGRSVVSRNAGLFVSWNSVSLTGRPDNEAIVPEEIRLTNVAAFLRTGPNVLAMHGLNESVDSPDMLIDATLDMTTATTGGIVLDGTVRVRARRIFKGEWSPLSDAMFHVYRPLDALHVTEVMYHPLDEETIDGDAFEFIELKNTGPETLDLSGVRFTEGITFTFPEGTVLASGRLVVLVANQAAFQTRYPGVEVFGAYDGNLSNGGERIALADDQGNALVAFTYDDASPWPVSADGEGVSLVPIAPAGAVDLNQPAAWGVSAWLGGSPGEDDPRGSDTGGWQRQGDVNQDSRLDISDAVGMLRVLFGGAAASLPCEGSGVSDGGNRTLLDVNGDARVDVADVISLLAFLFQHGAPPKLGVRCVRIEGCPGVCY